MAAGKNTYTYLRGARTGQVLVVAAIVVIVLTLFHNEPNDPLILLKTLLSLTAIGFLIHYGHTLNSGIRLLDNHLEVRHLFGASRWIYLTDVDRVVVQEVFNAFGGTRLVMTIYTRRDKVKISVSDLDRSSEFIDAIEDCGQQRGFDVLHVDRNGQTGRSLREG
ncbi:hypothetical protein GGR26_000410 [Lewinella marina]|uniref:DUF304 domain-containing protein n=1 Tax=Neolewinella marina TaxID=438751 RepID=A0A2G0CJL6_9BACT|nr:hypothetical protein [Neolewinella marina]NJB84665.1 hypothetical protein [Neolewinella marina]PHL00162.1 hypothetical protein CGL56_03735 [Neolewinella marina]